MWTTGTNIPIFSNILIYKNTFILIVFKNLILNKYNCCTKSKNVLNYISSNL